MKSVLPKSSKNSTLSSSIRFAANAFKQIAKGI